MIRIIQHVKAPNDINGNPRRLYIIVWIDREGHTFIAAHAEGTLGRQAVPSKDNTAWASTPYIELPPLNVTPTEYKRLLKGYPAT